jgi:hypothetical protein
MLWHNKFWLLKAKFKQKKENLQISFFYFIKKTNKQNLYNFFYYLILDNFIHQ